MRVGQLKQTRRKEENAVEVSARNNTISIMFTTCSMRTLLFLLLPMKTSLPAAAIASVLLVVPVGTYVVLHVVLVLRTCY
jgi:hypothetical protein